LLWSDVNVGGFRLTGGPARKNFLHDTAESRPFHERRPVMPATAAAQNDQPATTFAKDQLKSVIERIERLEEEKKATSDDIREVYAEAKVNGFDIKALRTIVRLRKQDVDERKEEEAVLETYMHALGMLN
jgi:uncharacterized protein (UPF0335 family)